MVQSLLILDHVIQESLISLTQRDSDADFTNIRPCNTRESNILDTER